MTTNQTPIPEPTSRTAVVVGKRDGETVVAAQMCNGDTPWVVERRHRFPIWRSWSALCDELTEIRVVPVAELAARPEPGPWLRGDELVAVMPTLKAHDVVEADCMGHTVSGELWAYGSNGLSLGSIVVRWSDNKPGPDVDALRIIERAPEPADPTGGDPVVVCTHETATLPVPHFRNDDGTWSFTGRSGNGWRTDQLRNVRRLNPETIADLMDGGAR